MVFETVAGVQIYFSKFRIKRTAQDYLNPDVGDTPNKVSSNRLGPITEISSYFNANSLPGCALE